MITAKVYKKCNSRPRLRCCYFSTFVQNELWT